MVKCYNSSKKTTDSFNNIQWTDIADFPGEGQTMVELEKWSDKTTPRKPANDGSIPNDSLACILNAVMITFMGTKGKKTGFYNSILFL